MRKYVGLIALAVFATGCATVVNGKYQTVSVDSFPAGAAITVDCGDVPHEAGVTPAHVKVQRAAAHCTISLARDGYETREIVLEHQVSRATQMNGVFALPGAIVFGLLGAFIGSAVGGPDTGADMGVDAGIDIGTSAATEVDKNGGAWKWVPGRVFVTLIRVQSVDAELRDRQ